MSDVENGADETLDIDNRRSSRRRESSRKQGVKSALEQLKEARASGRGHRVNVDDLHKDVYSIVDEEEFSKIRKQRQAEDFVVDDDGGGYVDHGEDFDEEDDDCEVDYVDRKRDKKKKKDKKEKRGAMDGFLASTSSNRTKVKDESKINLDGDETLLNLLATMDDKNLEPDYECSPMASPSVGNVNPFARGGTKRTATEDEITPRPVTKRVKRLIATPAPAKASPAIPQRSNKIIDKERSFSPVPIPIEAAEVKQEKIEDDDDFDTPAGFDDDIVVPLATTEVKLEDEKEEKINETGAKTLTFSFGDHALDEDDETRDTKDEPEVEVVAGSESFYVNAEDGTRQIRMYFMDAYEDPIKHNGTIYLFGRVMTSQSKTASCCVVVKNVHRQVFFLPRAKVLNNESGAKLHEEVKDIMHKEVLFKLPVDQRKFRCKPTSKKFMNNGTLEVADNCEERPVLEVQYPSTFSPLPLGLSGENFSGVFNITTTAMERLLVELEIMGPGWLDVSNYEPANAKQTYCEYEFSVDMERMKNIKYNSECRALPPFAKLLAINVLTTLNGKENEICMITAVYNNRCNVLSPNAANSVRYCLVTKPSKGAMPYDMKHQIETLNKNKMYNVTQVANEKAMLTKFLAMMQNEWEPDIFVGHDLQATMDLLKSRLQKLNIPMWSRTSRLRRTAHLNTIKNNKAGQWEFTAGRLLVDSRLAAMELVRSRSFDLTELVKVILNGQRTDLYANEVVNYYINSKQLLDLIKWSWNDSLFAFRIIMQLNALPLFLTITNIVGGVTSRTLMGGRAERNEFLLLHAFHRGNVIAPDKHQPFYNKKEVASKANKKNPAAESGDSQNEQENDGADDDNVNKNKAQYAGGLVLEPKKGLYETLILLLDFNSLYPSIIQEYNICFTTVKHTKDSDVLPEPPQDGTADGILPCEIRGLVERRKAVKRLMKDTNITEGKRKMYDIRQMALKLTANSMYGCLGFVQSRFYAKPLAALITFKGREILMHSKDLVEKMGYSVVYGDTDSIMINTNSTDLRLAKKLGNEIKTHVNKCHKLLELDLDGVFKRMLLLKKKKYAALTVDPDNESITKKELKGLDIVRRDWSQLAKQAGNDVVDLILDPQLSREELVAEIHETLRNIRAKLDKGKFELTLFEISKQLTRNPKEYADLKSQAHAAVATRLNDSGRFTLRQGDIVEYIICEDGTTNSATQRAYHRSELELNSSLKVDLNYYLAQQVHPVISRLCAPIEETDAVRIAEALGMDAAGYRRAAASRADGGSGVDELAWQGPLSYDHCDGFKFSCPAKCGKTIIVREFTNTDASPLSFNLDTCPQCNCVLSDYASFLINQLDNQLSECVQKHVSAPFKCDDQVCSHRMVSHPLKWSREGLECSKCSGGVLRKEYTSRELYEQQIFLKKIVNADEVLKSEHRSALEKKPLLLNLGRKLTTVVDLYLEKNAYNRVDLSFIFAPMLKI